MANKHSKRRTVKNVQSIRSGVKNNKGKHRNSRVEMGDPTRSENPIRLPSYDEIASRAFIIWELNGRPEGQELENWLQAERELRS